MWTIKIFTNYREIVPWEMAKNLVQDNTCKKLCIS